MLGSNGGRSLRPGVVLASGGALGLVPRVGTFVWQQRTAVRPTDPASCLFCNRSSLVGNRRHGIAARPCVWLLTHFAYWLLLVALMWSHLSQLLRRNSMTVVHGTAGRDSSGWRGARSLATSTKDSNTLFTPPCPKFGGVAARPRAAPCHGRTEERGGHRAVPPCPRPVVHIGRDRRCHDRRLGDTHSRPLGGRVGRARLHARQRSQHPETADVPRSVAAPAAANRGVCHGAATPNTRLCGGGCRRGSRGLCIGRRMFVSGVDQDRTHVATARSRPRRHRPCGPPATGRAQGGRVCQPGAGS